jgi:hypothetical protein
MSAKSKGELLTVWVQCSFGDDPEVLKLGVRDTGKCYIVTRDPREDGSNRVGSKYSKPGEHGRGCYQDAYLTREACIDSIEKKIRENIKRWDDYIIGQQKVLEKIRLLRKAKVS